MEGLSAPERGFLLLTSHLGVAGRKPMTVAQLRQLGSRIRASGWQNMNAELRPADLVALGYSLPTAEHIWQLLQEEELLQYYLQKGKKAGCFPITRASERYPISVRRALGADAPGCLWAKGDPKLLERPMVALVGSRDLREPNREFAKEAGRQAALQNYVLVSGNARGADKTAQQACLETGGCVISVVADALESYKNRERVLFIAEDGYDMPFSPARALSRNRVIHTMAEKTLVAQAALGTGGTWDGTVKNLRYGWSSVFCLDDDSESARELEQLGARLIPKQALQNLAGLCSQEVNFLENL